jgi:hypothetical protein
MTMPQAARRPKVIQASYGLNGTVEREPNNQFLAGDTRSCGQRGRSRGSLSLQSDAERDASIFIRARERGGRATLLVTRGRQCVISFSERCMSCPQRPNSQHREAGRRRQTRLRSGDAHPVRHPDGKECASFTTPGSANWADPCKRALTLGSLFVSVKQNFPRIYDV